MPRGLIDAVTGAPLVTGLLLAAGRSSRMGGVNKLLLPVNRRPMVAASLAQLLASRLDRIVVVTGHDDLAIRAALQPQLAEAAPGRVRLVHNDAFEDGLSRSLASGLGVVGARTAAVMVCLADMPLVDAAVIDALLDAFADGTGQPICLPLHRGRRGNPVLWPRDCFARMRALRGDRGAKSLLAGEARRIIEVPVPHAGVLLDADTPEALAAMRASAGDV